MVCVIGNKEKDRATEGGRKRGGGKRRNNHIPRRAEGRRGKLSYLRCNRGKRAFADWSCHGDGWHLAYVCTSAFVCEGLAHTNV